MPEEIARSAEPAVQESTSPSPEPAPATPAIAGATVSPEPVEPEPSTPQATEPPESGASPPVEDTGPKPAHIRKRDARQAVLERARRAQPDLVPDEPVPETEEAPIGERPRDDKGRFVSEVQEVPAEAADSGEVAVVEAAAPPVPEGLVRIELPETHPLRQQGRTYVDVPSADERVFRSLVNDPVQKKELVQQGHAQERLKAENIRLREQMADLKARTDVGDALVDPKKLGLYEDIKEKYGEEQAEEYRAGLEARTEQEVSDRRNELIRSQEMYAAGEAFRHELIQRAPSEFSFWGSAIRDRLAPHLEAYSRDVDAGHIQSPTVDDFFGRVRAAYLADPNVRAALEQWRQQKDQKIRDEATSQARAAVEAEAKTKEQERLVSAAQRRGDNPMGRLPRVETGVPSTAQEPVQPPVHETSGQRKRRLRGEAMARGQPAR